MGSRGSAISSCQKRCPKQPPHSVLALQTSAQQALTGTINSSMQAVNAAQATLDDFETLPPLGQDAVSAWGRGARLLGLEVCWWGG